MRQAPSFQQGSTGRGSHTLARRGLANVSRARPPARVPASPPTRLHMSTRMSALSGTRLTPRLLSRATPLSSICHALLHALLHWVWFSLGWYLQPHPHPHQVILSCASPLYILLGFAILTLFGDMAIYYKKRK